jgi:hypothetical protein
MATLYCPNCGYNLTGLPENRCPECGVDFDPVALARPDRAREPIPLTAGGAFIRILALPAIFWGSIPLALVTHEAVLFLTFATAFFQVFVGIFVARSLATRMAAWRAMCENRPIDPQSDKTYILVWTVVLHFAQVMAGIGGVIVFAGLQMLVLS